MKNLLMMILMFSVCLPCVAFAETGCSCVDPLDRNLIFVEGSASADVPADGFKIRFAFVAEDETFDRAVQKSEAVTNEMEDRFKAQGVTEVEIIRSWDLLKQAKVSFASKERKISNEIVVVVVSSPAEKFHAIIAKIIDTALAIDKSVVLEDVRVFLTDSSEAAKNREVTEKALENLLLNAKGAAAALGQDLVAPKRIWVTGDQENILAEKDRYIYGDFGISKLSKASISVNKGFSVQSNIADHVRISATVSGIYEIGK